MQTTAKYNLNIVEGNDIVNPLIQFNPNFQKIDETMYNNETASVGTATEIKSGSVHVITRVNTDVTTFKFVATSDYVAGETFTLDGEQVTAYTTDGSPLATNAYRIGAVVLVSISGSVMYFYTATVGTTTAENAEKLNGQPAEYYRTAEALNAVRETATSAGIIAGAAIPKSALSFDSGTGTLTITL